MSYTPITSVSAFLLAVCFGGASSATTVLPCRSISFGGQIHAGERFEKEIGGGLALEFIPQEFADPSASPSTRLSGWRIELVPSTQKAAISPVEDYIYSVNPPLRFNPWQDIGTSYSMSVEEKLKRPISYDFILTEAGYRKIWPLVTDALWPYSAKTPARVDEKYFSALKKIQLGQIVFSPIHYTTTAKGMSIVSLEFRVQISAPSTFSFLKTLARRPAACPARKN